MKRQRVYLTPAGGMTDTAKRAPIGYARQLVNCFYRVGAYVWRAGMLALHATVFADRLAFATAQKTAGGITPPVWTLYAASAGSASASPAFLRLVGSALVPIPTNGFAGLFYNADNFWRPWRACTVNAATFYACRRGQPTTPAAPFVSALLNVAANQVTLAGIPAPPVPGLVSSGTAGTLAAGTYHGSYRYRTSDGMYSPWSPVASAVIVVNEKRRWTVANSTHPRVVAKELAVSYVNGDERNLYFAFEIANNTTTTVDEDTATTSYDIKRPVQFDLLGPPQEPEDVGKWDARQWVVSNVPEPLLWPSFIDAAGSSQWELYDPLEAVKVPEGKGERYVAWRPWDVQRAVLFTSGSAHLVEPGAQLGTYRMTTLDGVHGCVSAAAADSGAGWMVWFDGRNILASRGIPGDTTILSQGDIDAALARVPSGYAERAVVKYVPEDGDSFWICVPGSSASTDNDIVLCARPPEAGRGQWHVRTFAGGTRAPVFLARVEAQGAGWLTVGCFAHDNRVMQLNSPTRRDAGGGTPNIQVTIETAPIEVPDGYGTVAVARVGVALRRRVDASLPDPGATVTVSASLNVNGTETTPVAGTGTTGKDWIWVNAQNLANPAADVSIVLRFDHPDAMEVYDIAADAVFFLRNERAL